jgi:hypothetical protein
MRCGSKLQKPGSADTAVVSMGLEVEAGKVGETVLRRRPKLRGKIPEWYGAGQRPGKGVLRSGRKGPSFLRFGGAGKPGKSGCPYARGAKLLNKTQF